MAQIRWYLNNSLLDGWQLVDQSAATAATCNCGWVVGTGATFSSELQSNTERASTTFVANTVPDGTLDTTLKDALRSQYAQIGNFDAGNWTFQFAVVSTVQSGAADGQIVFRVLKADFDGSNATEITTAQQTTTIATNVAGTDVNITATWAAPAWTITNQYLFVQLAWKRTGAGGMTTTNIRLRTGSSATVGTTGLTANFNPGTQNVTTATIPASAVWFVDNTFGSLVGYFAGGVSGITICQTISGHKGLLESVVISPAKAAGDPSGDNLFCKVHQGSFNGTLLATSDSVAMSSFPPVASAPGFFRFTFPTPLSLTAATTYWLQFNQSGAVGIYVRTNGGNTYPGGEAASPTGTLTGNDLAFQLYFAAGHTLTVTGPSQAVTLPHIAAQSGMPRVCERWPSMANSSSDGSRLTLSAAGANCAQRISGHTGWLMAVGFIIDRAGNPADYLYVNIRTESRTGPIIATSMTVHGSQCMTSGYLTQFFQFAPWKEVWLNAGTTYWVQIVATRVANDATNYYRVVYGNSTYAGGAFEDSTGTEPIAGGDATFELYTDAGSEGPYVGGWATADAVKDIRVNYRFDESSGDRLDKYGVGERLIEQNGQLPAPVSHTNFGRAVTFTAANAQHLRTEHLPVLTPDYSDPFMVRMLVRFTTKTACCILSKKNSDSDVTYELRYNLTLDRFQWLVGDDFTGGQPATVITATNFGSPPVSTWLMIHAWSNHGMLGISVNGGLANQTAGYCSVGLDSPLTVGGPGSFLNGNVDDLVILHGYMTPTQRHEDYKDNLGADYWDSRQISIARLSNGTVVDFYLQNEIDDILGYNGNGSTDDLPFHGLWRRGQSFTTAERFSGVEVPLYARWLRATDPKADGSVSLEIHLGDPLGALVATSNAVAASLFCGPAGEDFFRVQLFSFPTVNPGGVPTRYSWVIKRLGGTVGNLNLPVSWGVGAVPAAGAETAYYSADEGATYTPYLGETFYSRVLKESVFAPTVALATGGSSGLALAATYGVANWRLEEASGVRVDSINGYNATQGFGSSGNTTGKFGNALTLVAANTEFFYVADNTDVSGGATTITWRFWVKLTSKANHHEYLTKWGDNSIVSFGKNTEYAIAYNVSDDRFSCTISPHAVDGANEVVTATNGGSPSIGTWYLVHVWYDHPTKVLGIAVNGGTANTITVNATNFASGICNGSHNLLLGTLQTAGDYSANVLHADAVLDDIVILRGYALTAQDRTDDYNSGTGIAFVNWPGSGGGGVITEFIATSSVVNAPTVTGGATGLVLAAMYGVGNWRFEEAAGNTRVDSINAYNLIEQNGTQANTTGKFGNATLSVASDLHWLRTTTAPTNLSAGTSKFEIRVWVKLTTKAYSVLVSKWGDTTAVNREYALQYYDVPDRFQFVVWDLDATAVTLSADNFGSPTAGVWYLIHAWFDPSGSPDSIGISVNAGTPNTVNLAGNTGLLVGPNGLMVTALQAGGTSTSTTDVSGYANVALDDLVILKGHLLTAQDRTDDYNGGSGLAFVNWAGGGGGDQSITGGTRASTVVLNIPTIATGPVTVVGGTRASTLQLTAPTVTTGPVTVVGGTRATTLQVNAPTVAAGPVAVTLGTITSTAQVFAPPTIAVGAATIVNGTRPTTTVLNPPSLAAMALGATIPSGNARFAPSVALVVTTGTISTTAQVFSPTVAVGITTGTIVSGSVARQPTVATGPVTVVGGTIASGAQGFAPSVGVGVTSITTGTIGGSSAVILDDFNRANAALTSGAWGQASLLIGSSLSISSQQVKTTSGAYGAAYWTTPFGVDFRVCVELSVLSSTDLGETALWMLTSAVTGQPMNGYQARVQYSSGSGQNTLSLTRLDDGSAVGLGPSPVIALAANGAIGLERSGTTIRTWYRNASNVWVKVHELVESAYQVALTATLSVFGSTETRLDNFGTADFAGTGGAGVAQVFSPTVATGPVAVLANTISSTLQAFALSLAVGAVTVVGGTRTTTVTVNPPTLQTMVLGATILSSSALFAPSVTQNVTLGTRASTLQVFFPSVAVPAVQAVTAGTLGAASQVFAPSLTTGAVGVTTTFRASTLVLNAPSVAGQVLGATIISGSGLFAPSVAYGVTTGIRGATSVLTPPSLALTVTTAFRASTAALNPPTVTVGATTVVGGFISATVLYPPTVLGAGVLGAQHIPSTLQMRAPSVAAGPVTVTGGTVASTVQLIAPSVTTLTFVTGPTRPSTGVLFPPSLAPGAVTVVLGTRVSTLQMFAPSITVGSVTVVGGTIPSGSQRFPPSIAVGPTTAVGATCSTTVQLYPPTIVGAGAVVTVSIGSTVQLYAPSILGQKAVTTGLLTSTLLLYAPSLAPVTGVGAGTIGPSALVFAPLVLPGLTSGFISSTAQLYGPAVAPDVGTIVVGGLGPSTQLYPPSLLDVFPPTTCLRSGIDVRYLVTSATIDVAVAAMAGVHVRYLGTAVLVSTDTMSSGVQVRQLVTAGIKTCCVEA